MAISKLSIIRLNLFTVTLLTACVLPKVAESDSGRCELTSTPGSASRRWSFTLTRSRNESGRWVEFTSTKELGEDIAVDLTEQLFDCDGKKMIRLQGRLRDPFSDERFDDSMLKFHHMTGPNTKLINNGYTVVKLNLGGNGPVFTNRPLRTGELFEVRMDKRVTSKGFANGIGVTTRKPEDGGFPEHMNTLKSGTWLFYGTYVYSNNTEIFPNYSKINIYSLKDGDRVGVVRTDTGALNFFVNGIDQGAAASNIPETVYGVYELYGDATQATIVHPKTQQ